jgi:hypothetical protein
MLLKLKKLLSPKLMLLKTTTQKLTRKKTRIPTRMRPARQQRPLTRRM